MGDPVRVETRTLGGVPLLLAGPEGASTPLPTVLWFHGFGVDKEVHRPELERMAREGFLAVGVDAAGHGERRLPDLDARIAAPREEAFATMLGLARQTAGEVPGIVAALAREGLADAGRVAAVGISMGGYVVYGAVLAQPSLRAAVAILGSPVWADDGSSPHRRPGAFHGTALLSITAGNDENVPPDGARDFHRALAASHPQPGRARYLELPGAVHLMSAGDWERTMEAMLGWLVEHNR